MNIHVQDFMLTYIIISLCIQLEVDLLYLMVILTSEQLTNYLPNYYSYYIILMDHRPLIYEI